MQQHIIVTSLAMVARISSLKERAMCSMAKIQKHQNFGITEISERHPLLGKPL
jgi:hypothetical protein